MIRLQEWIHQLEVGGGVRVVRVGVAETGFSYDFSAAAR